MPGDTVEAWAEVKLQDKAAPSIPVLGVVADADTTPLTGVEFDKTTDAKGARKCISGYRPSCSTPTCG